MSAVLPELVAVPDAGAQIIPLRREPLPERPVPATPEISDETLLAACGVGDSAALGTLFDRYHQAVYRLISRLLYRDPSEIDDLVQQTFLTAWRSAGKFTGRGSVKSFLFGVAANLVRHHVRAERRRRTAHASWPPPLAGQPPDVAAQHAQDLQRFACALDELPHDLRAAYVLCELEDMPGAEAAAVLDVRVGTLWRRLHEARGALRDAMERSGGSQ